MAVSRSDSDSRYSFCFQPKAAEGNQSLLGEVYRSVWRFWQRRGNTGFDITARTCATLSLPFLFYLEMVSRMLLGDPLHRTLGNRIAYVLLGGLIALLCYKAFASVDSELQSNSDAETFTETAASKWSRRFATGLFFGLPFLVFVAP